jgi:preprotein translocase subunit YajC
MFSSIGQLALLLTTQAAPAEGASGCSQNNSLMLPVIMMAILYVVWIMPARKEQKKRESMLGALMRGDEVITSSGIFATIVDMDERTFTLEIAKNVRIRVLRSAVSKKAAELQQAAAKESKESKPSKT